MNTRLLLLITACALPSTALAQTPVPALESLFACEGVTDDAQRLSCLDAAVAALHSETDSGSIIALHRGEVEAAEAATFGLRIPGFSLPSLSRFAAPRGAATDLAAADLAASSSGDHAVSRGSDGQIDRIDNLAIARIEFNHLQYVVITLENGQVWEQIDSTHISRSVSANGGASIRRAALGSYMMRIGENSRWFRARRSQ